eukprot:CAMPEP_0173354486 /NCGR_PEP_ID=MMETSP1144-20121109/17213_1 /TAXON_ID=483371 /ORGANISM="non described non described, Strain CCMP2298" /LENGTH=66 /DNA_ID=CAMNT_0014303043 /DNA_START=132 /DNA_END=330 /DNA_ORIENTATION=+
MTCCSLQPAAAASAVPPTAPAATPAPALPWCARTLYVLCPAAAASAGALSRTASSAPLRDAAAPHG